MADLITSTEAAQILNTSAASICRYAQTGYLPTVWAPSGSGNGPTWFDRSVVEYLAVQRRQAQAWLNWTRPSRAILAELRAAATSS